MSHTRAPSAGGQAASRSFAILTVSISGWHHTSETAILQKQLGHEVQQKARKQQPHVTRTGTEY